MATMMHMKPPSREVSMPEYRVYVFRDFATLYYPDTSAQLASRRLRYLIARDPYLREGLERMGFRRRGRSLTPQQVAFLVRQLGSPEAFYEILREER